MTPSSRLRSGAVLGAAIAALLTVGAPARAADPTAGRIGPLNDATQDSVDGSTRWLEVGGATYFAANDPVHGTELFKHVPGSAPVLVTDIAPGAQASSPQNLVAYDGELYFTARGPAGRELWRSDGTAAGTGQVKDIRPGAGGSSPSDLAVAGGKLFFSADDGTTGRELWSSDGTAGGTQLVKDIDVGGNADVYGITALGTKVVFSADSELWVSDGTAAGTTERDAWAGGASSPSKFTTIGGLAYFVAYTGTAGLNPRTLLRTDGATVDQVTTFAGDQTSVNEVFASDDRLYLAVNPNYPELYTVDAPEGPNPVVRKVSGSAFAVNAPVPDGTGGAYFSGYADNEFQSNELHHTDGVASTPTKLTAGFGPFEPGALVDGSYFFAAGPAGSARLWMTDGTSPAAPHTAAVAGTDGLDPRGLAATSAGLYFSGTTADEGREPWFLETGESPASLGDLNQGLRGDGVGEIAGVGQTGFFRARRPGTGVELYRTDGTNATLVKDINPGADDSYPEDLTAFGTKLAFSAYTPAGGTEPWISDGTAAGTGQLLDVNPGAGSSSPEGFATGGGALWFAASDGTDFNLYRSDGTAAGTAAIAPLPQDDVDPLGYVDGKLWFILDEEELWSSDGTAAGTHEVALPDGAEASFGAIAGDAVYVVSGSALFRIAPGGTPVLAKDVGGLGIEELVAAGRRVVFSSNAGYFRGGPAHYQLWISDGSEAGTTQLNDGSLSEIGNLTRAGRFVYFGARDAVHGAELFRTDGTLAGTKLAAEFAPGDANGGPGRSVAVGADLVVDTNAGLYRVAPDGTTTKLLGRGIGSPDRGTSVPAPGVVDGPLVRVGGSVLFPLTEDGAGSANLWSTPAGPIGPAPADVPFDAPATPVDQGTTTTPTPAPAPAPKPAPAPAPAPAPKPVVTRRFGISRFVASARKGTGTLTLSVPRGGSLKITADGFKTVRRTLRSGTVKITLTPGRKLARTLRRKGRASVELRLRYVPQGGAAVVVERTVTFRRS